MSKIKSIKFGNSEAFPIDTTNVFKITFSMSGNSFICDKTYTQIATAVSNDDIVIGVAPTISSVIFPLVACDTNNGAVFSLLLSENVSYAIQHSISVLSDNSIIYTTHNIYYDAIPTKTTITGTTPSISVNDNTIYTCGEVTSLTLTDTANKDFSIIFTSGTTPTTFTKPASLIMPDNFEVEASKRYEINVSNNYALAASWDVSG